MSRIDTSCSYDISVSLILNNCDSEICRSSNVLMSTSVRLSNAEGFIIDEIGSGERKIKFGRSVMISTCTIRRLGRIIKVRSTMEFN